MKHHKRPLAAVISIAVAASLFGVPAATQAAEGPGRGASFNGLTTAESNIKQTTVRDNIGNIRELAQDPDQPGVTPGSDIEP